MANRFWVPGGTGNWNSTTNWSTTTGGSSGAAVPTSADDVFVNALSGTSPIITVNANVNCLSLDFTGAITPTFDNTVGFNINISGSFTLIANMTFNSTTIMSFLATSTGKTITTAGKTIPTGMQFIGVGGGWTLQDALTTTTLIHAAGTLNFNGKTVSCATFNGSGSSTRSLIFGASTINCSSTWTFTTTTGLTFNAGTSTINMTGNNTTFAGGGLTYNNVTLSGTPIAISGSNIFNSLTFTAGNTVNLTAGTTQTYTSLVANGTPASKITIQSVTAGSAATLSKSSGTQIIRNITLKDITATGGATFYALGTTNVSGNTGWAFQMLIKQEKLSGSLMALYHIDSTGTMTKVSG